MNQLRGLITAIEQTDGIVLLDAMVDRHPCTAVILGSGLEAHWQPGQTVGIGFREIDVAIALPAVGRISIRNQLPCTVTAVQHGKLMSRIGLRLTEQALEAVITRRAATQLALAPGMAVQALIKANDMQLFPEEPACPST